MFGGRPPIKLELDPELDEVFDEGSGSSFLALRRLRWSDTSEFKVDIRKWYISKDGEEVAGKGVSFFTEDGPTNLALAMAKHQLIDPVLLMDTMIQNDKTTTLMGAAHAMAYHGVSLEEFTAEYKKMVELRDQEQAEYVDLTEAIL